MKIDIYLFIYVSMCVFSYVGTYVRMCSTVRLKNAFYRLLNILGRYGTVTYFIGTIKVQILIERDTIAFI